MTFAAALGAKRKRRIPLGETSRKDPDPIPQDQFFTRGYESVINLLAIVDTGNPSVLSSDELNEDTRIGVFEEYANAGFEILQNELIGALDYSEQVLLILNAEREKQSLEEKNFDLSRFL